MARLLKISGATLNIRTHPHSPDRYVELMEDIYALRKAAKLRGDRYGMISLLDTREAEAGIVRGVVTTFLNIEFDGKWFDTSNLSDASDEDVLQVSIPEYLRPNSAQFYFVFDTIEHRLFFQTYSDGKTLTPASARGMFKGLFDERSILEKYGEIQVSIKQSKEGLERLFSIPRIKEISITIYKPNADIFADNFEDQIEAHLGQAHSKKVTISYEAEAGQSVVVTPVIRTVSEVALDNGSVRVRGRDESGAVNASTEDQPEIVQSRYDPDDTPEFDAFNQIRPRRQRR